jgi:hypothetical protein
VVERYEKIDAIHKELKQKEKVEELYGSGAAADGAAAAAAADGEADGAGGGADGAGDEAKIDEAEEAAFMDVKKRVNTTGGGATGSVRNLRIREDTAKYLLNLDVNSAHYDPKTRSMREDPQPNKAAHEKTFFGDNFVRTSGDYQAWQALNLHSMTAFDKGQEVHAQALPSYAELLHNSFKSKKEGLAKKSATDVTAKYGSAGGCRLEDLVDSCWLVEVGWLRLGGWVGGWVVRSGVGWAARLAVQFPYASLTCSSANQPTPNRTHQPSPTPAAIKPAADEAALLLAQTEHYVEYDRTGRVIKGQEVKARSK